MAVPSAFLIATAAALACAVGCGSSDSSSSLHGSGIAGSPAGGGSGGSSSLPTGGTSATTGGSAGTINGTGGAIGGTGGSLPMTGECTAEDVTACVEVSGATRCCTSAAQCGAAFPTETGGLTCVETNAPGTLDARCPSIDDPAGNGQFDGCCTPDNRCGVILPDLGCQVDASIGATGRACDAPSDAGATTAPDAGSLGGGLYSEQCTNCMNMYCSGEAENCADNMVCSGTVSCLSTCLLLQCVLCVGNGQTSNQELRALNTCLSNHCAGVCPVIG